MADKPLDLSGSRNALRNASVALIVVMVATKLVGFLREVIVAATFGTSQIVDVYLVAVTVPALFSTVLHYSIPNAFVPLLSGDHATRTTAKRLTLIAVLSAALLALGMAVFSREVAAITNSGFSEVLRQDTTRVLRLTSWSIVLATIEAFARSRLLVIKRFAWSGLAYAWQGVAIVVAVVLYPEGGAITLAWGYLVGTGLAAVWNLARALFEPLRATEPTVEVPERRPRGLPLFVIMIFAADLIAQLFGLIDRRIGSYLPEGSVAALQYANLIITLPLSIIGFGLSTAIFPYLAESMQADNRNQTTEILGWAARWSLLVLIPVTVWILIHSEAVVSLVLERGAFDAQARLVTASCLFAYAIGLIPAVLSAVLVRPFQASRKWAVILLTMIVGFAAKAGLAIWWVRISGVTGLAAATSGAQIIMLIALGSAGARAGYHSKDFAWSRNGFVVLVLSMSGALTARFLSATLLTPGRWSALAEVSLSLALTIALLLFVAPRLGVEEVGALTRRAQTFAFPGSRKERRD